jgi:hypothetical protein
MSGRVPGGAVVMAFRVTKKVAAQIRAYARADGRVPSHMLRMWVEERLAEEIVEREKKE